MMNRILNTPLVCKKKKTVRNNSYLRQAVVKESSTLKKWTINANFEQITITNLIHPSAKSREISGFGFV